MKRILFPLLMLAALLFSNTAWATDYPVYVGGVRVTDDNKANINPSGKTSGKISLDGTTLILDNVTMNTGGNAGVKITEAGYTVRFKGTNTLTSESTGLWFDKAVTLDGVLGTCATLNITVTKAGYCGIVFNGTDGTNHIYNLFLRVNTIATAISGNWTDKGKVKLSLSCVDMIARSSGAQAFNYYADIRFDSGDAMLQNGARFDASRQTVVDASGNPLAAVETKGSLYVGSVIARIGSNTFTLRPEGLTAGSIQYDGSSKTLKFNSAVLKTDRVLVDNRAISGLAIESSGSNTLTSTGSTAMQLRANTSFTGNGTLNLATTAATSSAISTYDDADVTIAMGALTAKGTNYGFYGQNSGRLTLNKLATGSSSYTFVGANGNLYTGELVMNDIDIWTKKATFKESDGRMYHDGKVARGTDLNSDGTSFKSTDLFTYYDLYVAGTRVHSRNNEDITSPLMTLGKASYDPATKTLALSDVLIENSHRSNTVEDYGIYHAINGLTVTTTGTNIIKTADIALELGGNTTFRGWGDITVKSTAEHAIDMRGNSGLTLQRSGGVMTVEAKKYGYYGYQETALTILKSGGVGGLYKFLGEEGNICNTRLVMGNGVNFHSKWTWYNADRSAVFLHDDYACGTDQSQHGTWIRGDIAWTTYPVTIAGTPLAGAIVDGVLRGNVTGFCNPYYTGSGITYDPATQTLNLDNVDIDYAPGTTTNDGVIKTESGTTLTIAVTGDNSLKGDQAFAGLWLNKSDVTITGDGTLSLSARRDDLYGLNESTVKVQGDVTVEALTNGIGSNNYAKELVVGGNAVVRAKQISFLRQLTLNDGHAITEPAGAIFADNAVRVGTAVAQDVVIKSTADGIEAMDNGQWTMDNGQWTMDNEVYDVAGRRLDQPRRGVNIVRTAGGKTVKVMRK